MENKDPSIAATELGSTANLLSTTIQAMTQATQATQALTAAVTQLLQTVQGTAGGAPGRGVLPAQPAQINTWEDDPFSEAVPTPNPVNSAPVAVNVPVINAPLLQVRIVEPQPAPNRHAPGTASFRYWTAAEALARGIGFWAPLLPMGTRWSTFNPTLQVTLVAPEQQLNAFYSRLAGLRFFQATVQGAGRTVTIFSGESPNVVCHELGHAILDALRPQLFNAASLEAAAFHEAFGDISSILNGLELPTLREKVLNETQGDLNVNSRLSRLAEQMGWGIRQLSPTAVDSDSLRNAANRFFYQQPERLPDTAPASQLSSEPHSFARVFIGAFLDALDGMLTVTGAANDASLLTVSRDMGQLLVDGIRTAPITPAYFSQVATAMIQADRVRNNGRYRSALTSAFIQRGILSSAAVANLATAPLPHAQAAPLPPAGIVGMVGTGGAGGFTGATGAQTLLTYNDGADDDGHQHGFADAPELPVRTVSASFGLNVSLLVHAPTENERFAVAPAALDMGSVEKPNVEYVALCFVEDLIRLGRLDLGSARGIVPELSTPTKENKTHTLEDTPDGLVLKRLHFDCGFYGHR